MARVEWSALSGDEVETLLANLYYNRDGRFLRIRPAQGDFGVDLILPVAANPQLWDVYQIKKFALNLTSGQKGQIQASFRRALVALVRHGLPLNDWYVVMPLDPTPDNVTWFNAMPATAYAELEADADLALTADELGRIREWLDAPGRTIAWLGLNACESLVADYPYVVDYYLHGGQQRIRDAVAEVAKLLQRDLPLQANDGAAAGDAQPKAALLTPGEIREHLLRLDRALDTDPHFRYGHSLDVNPTDLLPEPGLVAATQEQISGGRWLTFKVYVRSAQSLIERPIPVTMTFDFEQSAEDLRAIELWQRFGKPVQAAGTIEADMPGGLSRGGRAGTVLLSPAADVLKQARVRLRIVNPAGTPLAECAFRTESANGSDGMWVRGTDDAALLGLEMLIATDGSTTTDFRIGALAGREANAVLGPVRFAGSLTAPNTLQFAGAYGPFSDMVQLTMAEPLLPEVVVRFVENLDTIQTVTTMPVVIPDVSAMSTQERLTIMRTASLISGRTLVARWRPFKVADTGTAEFDPAGVYEFMVIEPLTVSLGSARHVLGAQRARPLSARIEQLPDGSARLTPDENDVAHFDFLREIPEDVTDRQMVYSRRIDDPAEEQ
ncbi:hypothetical protein AB0K35_25740 [Micromonospora sp. NPDC053740]|uniref:hypothetical protein n=1 Tax=Micromonospora sp. NPDC053740 TaxID=3155173 RepID=UPI00343DAB06